LLSMIEAFGASSRTAKESSGNAEKCNRNICILRTSLRDLLQNICIHYKATNFTSGCSLLKQHGSNQLMMKCSSKCRANLTGSPARRS
jgi:hypothetical protein